ncbi:HlyD family efflux transporter periplasmic adaptor subunit [Paraflavisolibacter sp. H34]|uniref:HlyD family secretion protein n=1 Tax=Huijunlia imazamoxiresistens TaxID=3127457 RepID=UPI00301806C5
MTHHELAAYQHIYLHGKKGHIRHWYAGFLLILVLLLFLPWTQTIRARGNVIALRQEQRTQEVNTLISGRIVAWAVKEGDYVQAGDTLVQLSEIKDSYLDPRLLDRTRDQIDAKKTSMDYYGGKAAASATQVQALSAALSLKLEQLQRKLQQTQVKIQSDSMDVVAAINELNILSLQYKRQQALYDSGLVSLTQLEQRNQVYQNALAKKIGAENKWLNSRQDLGITRIEISAVRQEYAEKISKAEGDRLQSLSQVAAGQGDLAKLENQYASYSIRNGMYVITAPQSGQVVKAKKAGIGEVLKEGEMLVQIVPGRIQYAVEMYVRPIDLPLVAPGQRVQFQFEGFPALVFTGWPEASYGMFSGLVSSVERTVSDNGKFRVLVVEDRLRKPWPPGLMVGTGASGIALLNDVRLGYEIWRNINSFPPDYYKKKEEPAKK